MRLDFEPSEIRIDGMTLPAAVIQAEMQYHPAESMRSAWREAATALVLKVLLHRRARALGMAPDGDPLDPAMPTDWLDALLEAEISVPAAGEDEYRRFHGAHPELFQEPMRAEAQHILLAAAPEDAAARREAKALAENLIAEIARDPTRFEFLAGKHSACPSAPMGGHLGVVERGTAVEEFETYLFNLDDGQLCPIPIESRYGFHVLRVIKRHPAKPVPYERVCEEVARGYEAHAWSQAVKQYLDSLIAGARIDGLELN